MIDLVSENGSSILFKLIALQNHRFTCEEYNYQKNEEILYAHQ